MILKFITANISSGVTDIIVKCTKANIQDYVDVKKAFHTNTDYDSKFSLLLEEFRKVYNIHCSSYYCENLQTGATFFEIRICCIATTMPMSVLTFISSLTTFCKQNLNI